jgi:hypothetical protein
MLRTKSRLRSIADGINTGFKKNVNRATTQVMMKTGALPPSTNANYHQQWPNQALTWTLQGMWRGPMIAIMRSKRGLRNCALPVGHLGLTSIQTIQDYGVSGKSTTERSKRISRLVKG